MLVEDTLSTLPEDIILYILSLMPTNFAMRTSILSKRWRYTWMLVENLNFDNTHDLVFRDNICTKIATQFVDRVMKFRRTSQVKLFRLHIRHSWITKSYVSRWIDEAVKLHVRELDINIDVPELPLSMFTCKTLTKLRLIDANGLMSFGEWPPSVCLPCLKSLDVVVYELFHADVFKLINGCPVLERLSLNTHWIVEMNVIFNIPTLKRLNLTLGGWCKGLITKVDLNVPNLEYLFTSGIPCSCFVLENVSSLVEARVSFDGITYEKDHLMGTHHKDVTFSSKE